MKTIVATALAGLMIVLSAGGNAHATTAYTCERQTLSRVAYHPGAAAQPAPCCTGMFGCPQLLANTGLVKPRHAART